MYGEVNELTNVNSLKDVGQICKECMLRVINVFAGNYMLIDYMLMSLHVFRRHMFLVRG